MNRLFLYSGFLFILILIFDAYDRDYNQPPVSAVSKQIDQKDTSSKQPPVESTENSVSAKTGSRSPIIETLENKKLLIEFDKLTGELLFAQLKEYPLELQSDERVTILDHLTSKYTAASNIQIKNKSNLYTYSLNSKTSNTAILETMSDGVSLSKEIKLIDGAHQISVVNTVTNTSAKAVYIRNYEVISRDGNSSASLMLPTYTGSAFYDSEEKFTKISFDEMTEDDLTFKTNDGWISMIEHYFFSAWLPTGDFKKTIYTNVDQSLYTIGSTTDYVLLNPGEKYSYKSLMFVGPKLQSEISELAPGLDLTVDYGMLTFLSAPLFWILDVINGLLGNWGFSIIVLTILIKALFFKLSETSYRSMAQMKKLNPRMQALKERYSEDKKKFSEALMRMYKEEKVNPLGGCLPILIQIPVFIALYWVLVESVEMRHAPFVAWINDLASADPYFILPIAMGISMFIQQKLNPAPTDATQQKIFLFLPFIFTALFATFPAGLVLYWLTNNILSIAQQYVINKRIVG